ncbi:MAG: hypothetical protein Q7U04_10070 [Bacteriovorax sp.]|nr:hypothetical protein [Bacteriovorax sp.]
MDPMTDSKFNMWRSCVAAVHLDGLVTSSERKWVEEKIQKLPLSNEQRLILIADLETKNNFEEAFKKISDKKDLAFLLNTLRVISFLDNSFSEVEKKSYQNLEAIVLKGINLEAITAEIESMELESYHEREVYKDYNKASIFEHIHHSFMKYLNPGDYKFPDKK